MILNTYLKSKNLKLKPAKKMMLGFNLIKSYRARFTEELKRVPIQENGVKMEVFDYPREFFEDEKTIRLVNNFLKKHKVINTKKTSKYEKV
jgi:hypothetical protein